jgi:hypothetical protein
MADIPISAFPLATTFSDTDVVAGLEGLITAKITRNIFLTALAGEIIFLSGQGSTIAIDAAGTINAALASGQAFNLSHVGHADKFSFGVDGSILVTLGATGSVEFDSLTGAAFLFDASGNIQFISGPGAFCFMGAGSETVQFTDGSGITFTVSGGNKVTVPFLNTNPGTWQGADPVDFNEAINRIALLLFTMFGPIP